MTHLTFRRHRIGPRDLNGVLALLVMLVGCAGCVTENPRHRDVPPPPREARPNRLALSVGQFLEDSDSNGYLDAMTASVYLFDERYSYTPLATAGSITFTLATAGGKVLRTWTFDEARTASARTTLPAGPGYLFRLSLLDTGGDRLSSMMAEVSAEFTGKDGSVVRSTGALPVRVGKVN